MFEPLLDALPLVLKWDTLLSMLLGTLAGIFVGATPGLTAAMAIALLLPLTFAMDPLNALGAMAGIYNGVMYGSGVPAILIRIPGTPASIATTWDGYPMAMQGRATYALQVAMVSSAVGGMVSALSLMAFAPPLSRVTLVFGPPEMFWVAVIGLASVSVLIGKDLAKGILGAAIGLFFATIGIDSVTGHERFTFEYMYLVGGLNIVVVLLGLFAIPPTLMIIEERIKQTISPAALSFGGPRLKFRDLPQFFPAWLRAAVIGVFIGILPGVGGNIAAFLSYNESKRNDPDPDSFGKGNPKGIAAAEFANNADNAASMIPALTLGVPGNVVAALFIGAFMIQGMQPGPHLFRFNANIVYGFMLEMFITAAMILLFGSMFATRLFARVLLIPPSLLIPLILCMTLLGIYTLNNSVFDLYVLLAFGILGYFLEKSEIPLAPAALGLILGPMLEYNYRTALQIGRGDLSIFFTRGACQVLIILLSLVILYAPIKRHLVPWLKRALS